MEENSKKRPAHEVKVAMIRATIWQNDGEKGPFFNVQLSRRYKSGDEWKASSSFSAMDLPNVVRATVLAEAWIHAETKTTEQGS